MIRLCRGAFLDLVIAQMEPVWLVTIPSSVPGAVTICAVPEGGLLVIREQEPLLLILMSLDVRGKLPEARCTQSFRPALRAILWPRLARSHIVEIRLESDWKGTERKSWDLLILPYAQN